MDAGDPEGNGILFQILILVFLTMVNAFFAGAEMAVVSVNKNKIRTMAEKGNKKAGMVQRLMADSTGFLSTIQVAITLAGFFSSASAATGISQVLGGFLKSYQIPYSHTIAIVIVTLILSYFTLVFGELVPKRVALQKAETLSLAVVGPVHMISKVISPFVKLLSLSTNGFLKLIGMKTENLEEAVTEEELKAMLETGSQAGVFNDIEKEMIHSVFSFDDKTAKDIMVPRREVYALDVNDPLKEKIDEILETRYTRIPVYDGEIDNIIGILDIKDFLIEIRKGAEWSLKGILIPPYYVPDSKNTDELFKDMQRERVPMAILIDEYGGVSGIVTIEDLVEEIVGEISDPHEEVTERIRLVDNDSYLIDGSTQIDELNKRLGLELQTEHYDTVSGFLIEKLEYIPTDEKIPAIRVENCEFTLLEVSDKRIQKVRLQISE